MNPSPYNLLMPAPFGSDRLNQLLAQSNSEPLTAAQSGQFAAYLALLQKWNARTNLTAIRDEEGILSRHFLESILCARALPTGIQTLLDFGSGAGFPGLPIAILHPQIAVTLAESQHKKAAFLREAIRTIGIPTQVHAGRAEDLKSRFDAVTLRAVDKMEAAIPAAIPLLNPSGSLILLTTDLEASRLQSLAGRPASFAWHSPQPLAIETRRLMLHGTKLPVNL